MVISACGIVTENGDVQPRGEGNGGFGGGRLGTDLAKGREG